MLRISEEIREEIRTEALRRGRVTRAREKRVPIVYPIHVHGIDANGYFFSETTETIDVSKKGCRFRLRTRVLPGAPLVFSLSEREDDSFFRACHCVVWIEAVGDGWEVGARRVSGLSLLPAG